MKCLRWFSALLVSNGIFLSLHLGAAPVATPVISDSVAGFSLHLPEGSGWRDSVTRINDSVSIMPEMRDFVRIHTLVNAQTADTLSLVVYNISSFGVTVEGSVLHNLEAFIGAPPGSNAYHKRDTMFAGYHAIIVENTGRDSIANSDSSVYSRSIVFSAEKKVFLISYSYDTLTSARSHAAIQEVLSSFRVGAGIATTSDGNTVSSFMDDIQEIQLPAIILAAAVLATLGVLLDRKRKA